MKKDLKNIRQISNINVIFISNDINSDDKVIEGLSLNFKEFKLRSPEEVLSSDDVSSANVIIIDFDMSNKLLEALSNKLEQIAPNISKIVVSSNSEEFQISNAINLQAYTFLMKPFDFENLKLAIIMCINQTKRTDKIELGEGIYFDEYRDQFYKKGGSSIDFTRLEKSFLKLLINKKKEITDYTTIKEVVWKGKEMSIYTMRNIVNKIRQKTYYEIIKNHSGKGYTIDLLEK